MPSARYWPLCLAGLLFAPLGVIAPKGEVPLLLALAVATLIGAILRRDWRQAGYWPDRNWIWGVLACGLAWALLSNIWTLDPLTGLATWRPMCCCRRPEHRKQVTREYFQLGS